MTPKILQIPEIALSIIINLDSSTLLSIRLVSLPINTLILTYQKSISRSIAQRQFSTDIDWCPPDIDCLQNNFHLKTLTRLPKAVELARRANKNLRGHTDADRTKLKGKRHAEAPVLKPTSSDPAFLRCCACAILIIGTINDIRAHLDQSKPLPSYVSSPPPLKYRQRLRRLFSRIENVTSKKNSASLSPAEANAQAISTYVDTIVPRSNVEVQNCLSAFDAARETYLKSLSRNHRIDLLCFQGYLYGGLVTGESAIRYGRSEQMKFAMQQSPELMLSIYSDDQRERDWAWNLADRVVHARQSDGVDQWSRIKLYLPEESWEGKEERAKQELTKGDWRDVRMG